ncbi:MAG: hypothetical protein DMG38_16270 [Acidobacteria bacterium]|nr:MAG: hypothetical protein DMG38_16270 [Acidobacteriota bacterium]
MAREIRRSKLENRPIEKCSGMPAHRGQARDRVPFDCAQGKRDVRRELAEARAVENKAGLRSDLV